MDPAVPVISGAAVAIAVPLITGWSEGARARQPVYEARPEALLAVLDEAAVAVDETYSAMVVLEEGSARTAAERTEARLAAREALKSAAAEGQRLAIRFVDAANAAAAASGAIDARRRGSETRDSDRAARGAHSQRA